MADREVHPSSIETLHVLVRNDHVTTGDVDISSLVVEVALPVSGVAASTWVTTTWESGTRVVNGERYYAAKLNLSDFTIANGSVYQAFARITTGGSNKAYVKGGRVKVTNT